VDFFPGGGGCGRVPLLHVFTGQLSLSVNLVSDGVCGNCEEAVPLRLDFALLEKQGCRLDPGGEWQAHTSHRPGFHAEKLHSQLFGVRDAPAFGSP
jgi:hypothetical protein